MFWGTCGVGLVSKQCAAPLVLDCLWSVSPLWPAFCEGNMRDAIDGGLARDNRNDQKLGIEESEDVS